MKKALILTGVSSGLGQALFDMLVEKDIFLVCISRKFLDYQEAYQREKENLKLLECDLNDLAQVAQCIDALKKELIPFQKLTFINNAGVIQPVGPIGTLSPEKIIESAHINFLSPALLINALRGMPALSELQVINISSGAAQYPIEGWGMYCATKAAIKMFVEVLETQSQETKNSKVVSFDPGTMDTPMQSHIREASAGDFPLVEEFKGYKTNNELRDPQVVASELIEKYIEI